MSHLELLTIIQPRISIEHAANAIVIAANNDEMAREFRFRFAHWKTIAEMIAINISVTSSFIFAYFCISAGH